MCAAFFVVICWIAAVFTVLAACIGRPFLIVPTILILGLGFYFKAHPVTKGNN